VIKFQKGVFEMTQITLQNAEKNWAEILQKALNGEEVIIERDGKPVAKVSPYKAEEDWFGMDEGKVWIADDFDETPEEFSALLSEEDKR
jgi:antitoxin (DNA-binding transcriptional repressor) of toxin-antitoxin stability system